MARWMSPLPEHKYTWRTFVKSLPLGSKSRETAELIDPWAIYILLTTGQKCVITKIGENGNLAIGIPCAMNPGIRENVIKIDVPLSHLKMTT